MGRAVFRQEGLYNSNKIARGCYTRYHDVNKTFAHQLRAVGLVSGQKAIANSGQMQ